MSREGGIGRRQLGEVTGSRRTRVAVRGFALRAAALLLCSIPATAEAQHAVIAWAKESLVPSVTGAIVEHRVNIGEGAEQATGVTLGLRIDSRVRPWLDVRFSASGGRLEADWAPSESRTMGEIDLTAIASPLPWLGIVTNAMLRGYEGDLGRQRWVSMSVGPEARLALYRDEIWGSARIGVAPYVAVSGSSAPERSLSGSVALSYARSRLGVGLEYSLERYDFAAGALPRRFEQISGLSARVGWKF